jgi:hypothetical protein
MQLLKKVVACLILLSVVAGGAAAILPAAAHGDDIKTVRILNTPLEVRGNVNAVVTGAVNASVTGTVGLVGTPAVLAQQNGAWQVGITGNTAANPLFVQQAGGAQPVLVSDGKAFALPADPNVAFEFAIPANVVLTDVQLSLHSPALAATIFVSDGGGARTYVYQSVGSSNSTFAGSNAGQAAIHFQTGLQSASGFRVGIICNNIGGNSCAGALMWSGFERQ